MNDYKKLVAELRKWQTLGDAPVGNGFAVIVDKLTLKQAADAIEQLVKDNESYKCAFADLHNEIANHTPRSGDGNGVECRRITMRLIDVSKLTYSVAVDDNDRQIFYVPAEEIDNAPTIDAEPVRHGHWVWGSAWYPPTCSVCNLVPLTPGYIGDVNFYERYFKRCPNCGAKMRGTEDE